MLVLIFAGHSLAAIRIASYNTAQGQIRAGFDTVMEAIGDSESAGISRPVDLLLLQEQDSEVGTTTEIKNRLRSIYPGIDYRCGTLASSPIGIGGSPGVVYNYALLRLLEEAIISSPGIRDPIRYKFALADYPSPDAVFYVYVCHLKATSDDAAMRGEEAAAIRSDADALGEGVNIIIDGDLNLYSSSEPAWTNFTASGNAQMFDPVIGGAGYWHDNAAFKSLHSQAPSTSPGPGLVGGGMDDRFDFQLLSAELNDADGFAAISGTFRVLGNNGTHKLNGSISTGTGASAAVLSAIESSSDHCPIILDYQVPAVMTVDPYFSLPAPHVVSSTYHFPLFLSNTADTPVAVGADVLDYSITLTHTPLSVGDGDDEPMNGSDIGTGQQPGNFDFDTQTGEYTILGSGVVGSVSDTFYYVHDPLTESGSMTYRLDSITSSLTSATAGIMVRSDLAPDSVFGYLYVTQSGYLSWRRRFTAGQTATTIPPTTVTTPLWLRVSRSNNTLTASTSTDGANWTELVSEDISLPPQCYIGLVSSSGSLDQTSQAQFSPLADSGSAIVINIDSQASAASDANDNSFLAGSGLAGEWLTSVEIVSNSQAVKDGTFSDSLSYTVVEQPDVTGDDIFSIDDINMLLQNMNGVCESCDYDNDGIVTLADMDILLGIMGVSYGDFDLNMQVDSDDMKVLTDNWLKGISLWQNADMNGDNVVDFEDFALFSSGWTK